MELRIESYSEDNTLGYAYLFSSNRKKCILKCTLNYETGEAQITKVVTNNMNKLRTAITYLKYKHDFIVNYDVDYKLYRIWLKSREIFNHSRI